MRARDFEEPRILNLMDALKASVAKAQSGGGKMAPSVRGQKGSKKRAAKKKMAPSRSGKKTTRRKKSG